MAGMRTDYPIEIPLDAIAEFCKRKNHIRKLSLFGSVLRDDFTPESDIDVLVEFEEGITPGGLRRWPRSWKESLGARWISSHQSSSGERFGKP